MVSQRPLMRIPEKVLRRHESPSSSILSVREGCAFEGMPASRFWLGAELLLFIVCFSTHRDCVQKIPVPHRNGLPPEIFLRDFAPASDNIHSDAVETTVPLQAGW